MMMEKRIPLKSGDEFDAFTSWRKMLGWKAGTLKDIKNGYRRRMRKEHRKDLNAGVE